MDITEELFKMPAPCILTGRIPTVASEPVIGIRAPETRRFAKRIAGSPEAEKPPKTLPHAYYEEDCVHAFLIEREKDSDRTVALTDAFLPCVGNRATCDSYRIDTQTKAFLRTLRIKNTPREKNSPKGATMNHFFAYMARMRLIRRWSLMKSVDQENIAEHSLQVAQIAHAIALIGNRVYGKNTDVGKVALTAMYHETSEVITGDLPTPIKYYNPEIRAAYREIEKTANDKLLSTLPEELRTDYDAVINPDDEYVAHVVKAADKISAYIKCIEELRSGNREFAKAEEALRASVQKHEDALPEVRWFCEHFLDAFRLTLDELK